MRDFLKAVFGNGHLQLTVIVCLIFVLSGLTMRACDAMVTPYERCNQAKAMACPFFSGRMACMSKAKLECLELTKEPQPKQKK